MRSTGERRRQYDEARAALEWWLGDKVAEDLREWASGDTALEMFGSDADTLDALCLMSAYARETSYALLTQVELP